MTAVYITIDTEYSAGLAQGANPVSQRENFARSISCETPQGPVGVFAQMDIMDRYGCKGVFFVDPMPALVWDVRAIADVVEPIVARGHDVQLHMHTEWLELAGDNNPLPGRTGRNIRDFSLEEQVTLIERARELLIEAGAPPPTAFRAGNYGANDDTLRALAQLGFAYDSSHVPGIPNSDCTISLTSEDRRVTEHCGVLEVPVGTIRSMGSLRHAQVTALSAWEMAAAIRHAIENDIGMLNIVSHSFELMSRDRSRTNTIVRNRFEKLCQAIAKTPDASSATFTSRPPEPGEETGAANLPENPVRTAARVGEQALGNALYGRG